MFGFLFKKSKQERSSKSKKLFGTSLGTSSPESSSSRNLQMLDVIPELSSTGSLSASSSVESGNFSLNNHRHSLTPSSNSASLSITMRKEEEKEISSSGISESEETTCTTGEDKIGFIDEEVDVDDDDTTDTNGCNSEICLEQKRRLSDNERKAMVQLETMRSKLIGKETELSLLQADFTMLSVDKDNKALEIERLTTKLNSLKAENDTVLKRIHKLELDLEEVRSKNTRLRAEVVEKSQQIKALKEDANPVVVTPIRSTSKPPPTPTEDFNVIRLEKKIKELESDKGVLSKGKRILEEETTSQIRALQDALEEALEGKIALQTKYDKELRELQESNSSLFEDFEWKIHQVESNCRNKLLEKDKQLQEKSKEAELASSSLSEERKQLEVERRIVQQQYRQVEHLKSFEAEVIQLRGVTSEQQKALKAAARQLEQLKFGERILTNEIAALRLQVEKEKAHWQTIASSNQRKEQNVVEQLAKQKEELDSKWEIRLKEECSKTASEISKRLEEQRLHALESMRDQKDEELSLVQEGWERSRRELIEEVTSLKESMKSKENEFQENLRKSQEDHVNESSQLKNEMELLREQHAEELNLIRTNHQKELETLKEAHDSTVEQLNMMRKKLEEFERSTNSSDSVVTEKDSGIVKSTVGGNSNANNEESEYSSESDSENLSEDEDHTKDNEEDEDDSSSRVEKFESVTDLREEVASLQDSVETLTLNLVKNAGEGDEEKPEGQSEKDLGNTISSSINSTPTLMKETSEMEDTTSSSASLKSPGNDDISAVSDTDNESESDSSSFLRVLPINPRRLLDFFRPYRGSERRNSLKKSNTTKK